MYSTDLMKNANSTNSGKV